MVHDAHPALSSRQFGSCQPGLLLMPKTLLLCTALVRLYALQFCSVLTVVQQAASCLS